MKNISIVAYSGMQKVFHQNECGRLPKSPTMEMATMLVEGPSSISVE